MVGGGIFSVLGVLVQLAGPHAWLSLVLGGAVALLASLSYVALSTTWKVDGGAYGYLRQRRSRGSGRRGSTPGVTDGSGGTRALHGHERSGQ